MTIDYQAALILASFIPAIGAFVDAVVHWDKLKPVIISHAAFTIAEFVLIFGCVHFGPWAVLVGAYIHMLLVFFDFLRTRDNSCAAIGSAILTTALGVFCFATQFAVVLRVK